MRFFHIVSAVVALLQREGRVTYWALKQEFGFDDAFLEGLREELIFAKRVACDEGGKVLVWTGELPAVVDVVSAVTSQHRAAEAPVKASPMAFVLPPLALANTLPATPPEVLATSPALVQAAPEAERRQVTVMFCDLVDSTKLSRQLDPEDYRAVVRTYQAAAAEVMQPYNGYIAQYLGDGLMVYFGWPQAHEDAASRAVYASLAILDALGPLTAVAIPATLQDSLMARLDQLHAAKEVAQLGAVLGREFPYEMLQAVPPQDEETLQAGLMHLVAAELLYQRGRPPRARYIFKHALIQDAAYASLLRSTRQQALMRWPLHTGGRQGSRRRRARRMRKPLPISGKGWNC